MNMDEYPYEAPEDGEPGACFVSPVKVVMTVSRFYFSRRFPIITGGLFLFFTLMTWMPYHLMAYFQKSPLAAMPLLAVNTLFFVLFIKYYTNMFRKWRRPFFSDISAETVFLRMICVIVYVFGGGILVLFSGAGLCAVLLFADSLLFDLLDYSTGFGVLGLCFLFLGGCLSPGGWLIVEYSMDPLAAFRQTVRISMNNLPTLMVLCGWMLLIVILLDRSGVLYGKGNLVHPLVDYHIAWFFAAPYLMLHYPVFCMLAAGEEIG